MSIFRSCMVSVMISFSCWTGLPDTSRAASVRGMTPVMRPPARSTARAMVPIRPMLPPPNTISMPSAGIASPRATAAFLIASPRGPDGRLDPQNTATRRSLPLAALVLDAAAASSPSLGRLLATAHASAAPAHVDSTGLASASAPRSLPVPRPPAPGVKARVAPACAHPPWLAPGPGAVPSRAPRRGCGCAPPALPHRFRSPRLPPPQRGPCREMSRSRPPWGARALEAGCAPRGNPEACSGKYRVARQSWPGPRFRSPCTLRRPRPPAPAAAPPHPGSSRAPPQRPGPRSGHAPAGPAIGSTGGPLAEQVRAQWHLTPNRPRSMTTGRSGTPRPRRS